MMIPDDLLYTESHEWIKREGDNIRVGITDHAQERLGDMVFVEVPGIGKKVLAGTECAVVESVKAASDVYAPVSGEVIAVNAALLEAPQSINQDAYASWLFRLKPDNPAELDSLLDARSYSEQATSEA